MRADSVLQERFGERTWHELWPIGKSMDQPENRPELVQHEAWGKYVAMC